MTPLEKKSNHNPFYEEKLSFQLEEIRSLLYNDTKTGRQGLVQKVDKIREDFDNYLQEKKTEEAVKKGQMAIYGAIGAFILWLTSVLAKLLFPMVFKFL